ncbi:hypothetical protein D1804_01405 [Salmonella enterica subsp. enterica serovar Lagos]|nr:hypothetical protein LFZ14_15475 [Salmonella enterica subsp. enterica serovar Hillingdon str. N1529-D3]EAP5565971.1 hypothetical protein [Salmonella enterica]EAU3150296.1 hypothetical protein [Salmonella enterica]EBH8770085.1 hypothetical protein [Salmonella enterica subsp. enterica serovar Lagos]
MLLQKIIEQASQKNIVLKDENPRHFQEMSQPRQKKIILIIFNCFLESQTRFKLKTFIFNRL